MYASFRRQRELWFDRYNAQRHQEEITREEARRMRSLWVQEEARIADENGLRSGRGLAESDY